MTESKEQILKDIKENICNDFLNAHDPSVGIYRASKIDDWVIEEINESEGIKVVSYTSNSVLLDCDVCKVEVYYYLDRWEARIFE
jgi:hypothetical protein